MSGTGVAELPETGIAEVNDENLIQDENNLNQEEEIESLEVADSKQKNTEEQLLLNTAMVYQEPRI